METAAALLENPYKISLQRKEVNYLTSSSHLIYSSQIPVDKLKILSKNLRLIEKSDLISPVYKLLPNLGSQPVPKHHPHLVPAGKENIDLD